MHSPTGLGFRPPAPTPQPRPLGPLALLKALRTNPLECWTRAHFEQPIVLGGFPFARVAVVSDPAAIRQVLVEDQLAYCKSAIERRVLAARMPNGLVTVDGEHLAQIAAPAGADVRSEDDGRICSGDDARRRRARRALAKSPGRQRLGDQNRDEPRRARRPGRLHLFRWARRSGSDPCGGRAVLRDE